jgi:hypothetical protein
MASLSEYNRTPLMNDHSNSKPIMMKKTGTDSAM